MLSRYFEIKTGNKNFDDYMNKLFSELKDKKVIIYGAGEGFLELNKIYNFNEKLNVVAVADRKFENSSFDSIATFKSIGVPSPSTMLPL